MDKHFYDIDLSQEDWDEDYYCAPEVTIWTRVKELLACFGYLLMLLLVCTILAWTFVCWFMGYPDWVTQSMGLVDLGEVMV